MSTIVHLGARILPAHMFVISGWGKIGGYAATQTYMASQGVPGALLPLVILLELGGGLCIAAGWFTRWVALALAVFSVASALLFHMDWSVQGQQIQFMKNLTIAGGFLLLFQHGASNPSVDTRG